MQKLMNFNTIVDDTNGAPILLECSPKNTKMLSISFNSGTLIKLDNLIMSKTTYIMATAVLSDVH